ncbi:MAG: threonylcarbamoyl-AMP synthase [Anaerolinea sp.]|nr:threonylcarbamoyl-AMP synthase [Anaerolinea sp.]
METRAAPSTPANLVACAAHLAAGRLAILPTDTVYGIVADASDERAVRAIYDAKGKGSEAPLQLLFGPSRHQLDRYAALTPVAEALVEALGPGGWTIIVPARTGWSSAALAGGTTVGFRIPGAPVVHRVVELLGGPLAASSANRHGGPSPTTCEEAIGQVGEHCACAIDAGPTREGLDSTVIDCAGDEPRVLREGAIDRLTVARILGLETITVLRSVRP